MKSVLYIGQYSKGTTSKMRGETLKKLLSPCDFSIVDTQIPFYKTARLLRSFGFRYKFGPLINNVNDFIQSNRSEKKVDLIWVDKGIFINKNTISLLKQRAKKLVHFTPDMAFYANKSKLFNTSLPYYDAVITTKSRELELYKQIIPNTPIVCTTQGFDAAIHKPFHSYVEKENAVVFIGLAEPERIKILQLLIDNGVVVKLVGKGWHSFATKNSANVSLQYLGETIYDTDYSKLISSCKLGLGLLSKKFPELHTTRTFEIPACGTALITEANEETMKFFNPEEAIFYNNHKELLEKIKHYLTNENLLEPLTLKGLQKVHILKKDYQSIMEDVLTAIE